MEKITEIDKKIVLGKEKPKEEVEFILIGAGLPRTGTTSTYAALEIILPGKCHHMASVFMDKTPTNKNHWLKAAQGALSDMEWKQFISSQRLSAGVDFPMSFYWKDLLKIYPNAKVLLSDRDPVKWYQSVKNTIYQIVTAASGFWGLPLRLIMKNFEVPLSVCRAPIGESWPGGLFGVIEEGEDAAVRFFNDWKEEVIKTVPEDRLLVWQVKDGWGPLCKFLGLPEPGDPFPNLNDTAQQQKMLAKLKMIRNLFWAVLVGGLAAGAYLYDPSLPSKFIHTMSDREN